ncbi:MAG TPA: hypothetical protein PKC76_01815 [Saprospiraceae bacterium]|nr:hypothetical protein [Saprospiraceae bacterium]HMP22833.1 hypothetical protein [Saprospiraceae bacterium]
MKPLFIFCLSCLCTTAALQAQDLHVYYDMQTQTPRYVIDSQRVDRPYVRRGSNVILHIENYNNYVYDVVIEVENREIRLPSSASGGSIAQMFPTLGQNSMNFLALGSGGQRGIGDSKFNLAGTEDGRGEPRPYDASLGIGRQEYDQLNRWVEEFGTSLKRVQEIDETITQKRREVQSLTEVHQINAFVLQEIENIKRDPSLPPDKIKKMTREYMRKVLSVENDADVNLEYLLEKGNVRRQLSTKFDEVRAEHNKYRREIAKMNNLRESMSNTFTGKPVVNTLFVMPVVQTYDQVEAQDSDYTTFEDSLGGLIAAMPDTDALQLARLWREYEALLSNPFDKSYRAPAKGDNMTFNIRFTPGTATGDQPVPALQMAPIEVPVIGGFKVNASIGVAFGQFFNRPLDYFTRDNVIFGETKDSFYPVISSFFHFYSQSRKNATLGGSFGIGLPITGGNAGQSASFFLGPSLIIGNSDRVVLSTGLMGSRVERLGQGLREGDTFISSVNAVPTRLVYETGFFVGLSFNVFGGN